MTRRRKPADSAFASEADRFQATRAAVAADLGVEPDSALCQHVTMLRLQLDNMLAASIRGEVVAVANIRELDTMLKPYLPERETLQIVTSFVEGVVGRYVCQHCHQEDHLEPGSYTPVTRKPFQYRCECGRGSEISVDGPFTDGGDPGKPVAVAEPEAPPNGVQYREGISGSAFHAAVLRNDEIPPLRKEQPAIGAQHAGNTVRDLWRNDPNPTRGANGTDRYVGHKLPEAGFSKLPEAG
jgi:hypothetical protein